MRRLGLHGSDGERGATAVITAICMVALLGFAALVIDVGRLYAERAQLQSGADAVAVAVAQQCARQAATGACAPDLARAQALANGNANDAATNLLPLEVNQALRTVRATTGAREAGSPANRITMQLAQLLGITDVEVGAASSAAWGSPIKGTTGFPVTFSVCQVQGMVDGGYQLLQGHGDNANPDCNYGPSGAAVQGGFGWLVQDAGKCGGFIDLAIAEGGSEPGNSGPPNCTSVYQHWQAELAAGRKPVVLLPVFNQVAGTGSGASYGMVSFAAFEVAGWRFTGSDPYAVYRSTTQGVSCEGSCRGIIGKFVTYVSLSEGYTLGPVQPHGATVVQLTS